VKIVAWYFVLVFTFCVIIPCGMAWICVKFGFSELKLWVIG
jgi:hypothetical protein